MPKSILIADDHDVIRAGIRNILCDQSDYEVAAEAIDGKDALVKVKKFKPDILLLDISMPKMNGLDIIEPIHRVSPETKIIIITVHKARDYMIKAFKAGIKGYLYKENAGEELLPALRSVTGGKTYLSLTVSSYSADKISGKEPEDIIKENLLTEREEKILRLAAEGKTAREIAEALFISHKTVENHKSSIFKKLDLHKTSDFIRYSIKYKISGIERY